MMPDDYTIKPDNLYLLSVLDVIDRLDVLLLEIRHIQQTIIYLLRTPTLYLPQRYEEKYIFGKWDELSNKYIKDLGLSGHQADTKLANLSIIRYPSPSCAVKRSRGRTDSNCYPDSDDKAKQKIMDKLRERVAKIWIGDVWARGQRRHYHALRALQILKIQVFRDKLTLFREAEYSGLILGRKEQNGIEYPALMILLDAIKNKASVTYIKILRTHQQNLSKSLSYGLQDYPRPLVERRRDIGIFADFLSERTCDIQKDMLHLINTFLSDDEKDSDNNTKPIPLILHGWSPAPHTSNMQLFDDVGRMSKDEHEEKIEDVNYVDSSFWSPDRPDLQPLIAHEIGNSLVCHIFKKLNDDYISNTNNDLARLTSELFNEINDFTKNIPELAPIQANIRKLLKKIISDLLAASVKGISYVYALFLALAGRGLGDLLKHHNIIRLDRVGELHAGIAAIDEFFYWYFRLKISAFWMQQVMHIPTSRLDKIVLDGTGIVCNQMLDYLDKNTPASRTRVGEKWKELEQKLEVIIGKSPLVIKVRNWREKRSCDTWNEAKKCSGDKVYYRSTVRLNVELQNYLFREMLNSKMKRSEKETDHPISKKTALTHFQENYGFEFDKITIPNAGGKLLQHPQWLFRHLYDIPFQCAAIRSIDLLKHRSNSRSDPSRDWSCFIKLTHEDLSLGREFFALALEFYTWGRESTRSRLLICVNLIAFSLHEAANNKELYAELQLWLNVPEKLLDDIYKKVKLTGEHEKPENLINTLATWSHRNIRDLLKDDDAYLRCIGATNITDAFSNISKIYGSKERRLEQISGYKLRQLYSLLESYRTVLPASFLTAFEYLYIHNSFQTERMKEGNNALASTRFHNLLLASLGDSFDYAKENDQAIMDTPLPEKPSFVMVNHITMTNHYPIANPLRPTETPDLKSDKTIEQWYPNGLSLKEGLELKSWNAFPQMTPNKFFSTLGQYDAIGLINVQLPCKCRMPSFMKPNGNNDQPNTNFDTETEKFVTHFSLREIAIPVQITKQKSSAIDIPGYLDNEVLAIISVSLQRRSMRLSLLCRILQVVKDVTANKNRPYKYNLHADLEGKLADFFTSLADSMNIHALLTDGWGDVLLVFTQKDKTLSLEHSNTFVDYIFQLQKSLYEDFMVDRTEVTIMPPCLDSIMCMDKYSLQVNLRFMEDRRLEQSISNYLRAYQEPKDWDEGTPEYLLLDEAEIVRTPGRMDLSIQFDALKKEDQLIDFYGNLIKFLAKMDYELNPWFPDALSMLSKMETVIEYRHPITKKKRQPTPPTL